MGNNYKDLKVEECPPHILATVVDFIYGIRIPEDIGSEDAKSLLAMADLYLMEDLKDAVGQLIRTTKDNILEISKMAEMYSAQKLKEMCCEFIFQNLNTLDRQMLIELNKALPLVGEKALLGEGAGESAVGRRQQTAESLLEEERRRHCSYFVDIHSD